MKESTKNKLDPKLKFGDKNFDLDEPPLVIDISICLPDKKAPEEAKTIKNPKNIILF